MSPGFVESMLEMAQVAPGAGFLRRRPGVPASDDLDGDRLSRPVRGSSSVRKIDHPPHAILSPIPRVAPRDSAQ